MNTIVRKVLLSKRKNHPQYLPLYLAGRISSFSPECEECQGLQCQISQTGDSLTGYLGVMRGIVKHLKHSHGLVEKRHYVKRCVLISVTAGISLVLLGLVLLSFGITLLAWNITMVALVVRVIFSYTIGYFLDKRAQNQGRVL